MSKLNDVINMMVTNPKVKAGYIAKKHGITMSYTYTLMSQARKRLGVVKVPKAGWKLPPRMQAVQENQIIVEAPTKADNVNHPAHYKVGGIETIDFIEAKKLNYNIGNVVKYVTRADHKGNRLEDLEKARWYLDREIGILSEELATKK